MVLAREENYSWSWSTPSYSCHDKMFITLRETIFIECYIPIVINFSPASDLFLFSRFIELMDDFIACVFLL